ncbi:MAG TPA: MarR family transcriptional regulator [Gaiellaceae bacterium]|jgi:DNA-binding MarR family transcriptional regulator
MSNAAQRADAPATLRPWRKLTPEQLAAWSGFLRGHAQIVRALDAELEREHGLALTSYDVLIQLSLAPDRRLRMFELADAIVLSRSGLTRLVDRLERCGLVERERGEVDPRQIYAKLTDRGLEVLADATPTHIAGIQERFLDRLSDEQTKQLAAIWQAVFGP